MKEHYVVRTFPRNYLGIGNNGTEKLEDFLEDGWIVVMATPVDNCIEYIIEIER